MITYGRSAIVSSVYAVAFLIILSSYVNSQESSLLRENQQTFVKISVESPILEKGKPDAGSGVLISFDGHILTAGHVIGAAVDEGSINHTIFPLPSSNIFVQFLNSQDQLEPIKYKATIQYYSPIDKLDIALLKIDLPIEILQAKPIPTLDPASANVICSDCFIVFGFTDRGFEWAPASPGKAVQSNYRRLLVSNMTYGYSGGPVYRKSLDSWTLVGIAISGDKVRQVTNFMVTLHAAQDALAPFRDGRNFNYRERPEFPSQNFKDWSRIDFSTETDSQIKSFVERKLKVGPADFVRHILDEDFTNVVENQKLANTAKLMLEHALAVMFDQKSSIDAQLFTLIVEKVVTLYELLGIDDYLTVARWREDAVVHQESCERLGKNSDKTSQYRCWQRLDWKQQQLSGRAIKRGFANALQRYRQRQIGADSVIQWSIARVVQLMEWGDFWSKVGTQLAIDNLTQLKKMIRLTYLDENLIPPPSDNLSPRAGFVASGLDKHDDARNVFAVVNRDPQLKKSFSGGPDLKTRLCSSIRYEITVLRDLLRNHSYAVNLEGKLTNEINPFCR